MSAWSESKRTPSKKTKDALRKAVTVIAAASTHTRSRPRYCTAVPTGRDYTTRRLDARVMPPSSPNSATRRTLAGVVAVGSAAMAWFYTRLEAPDAIWSTRLSDHPGYSPVDSIRIQEVWPTHLSDLSASASIAAALAVLVAFAILRRVGAGPMAASAAALGMALGG